MDVSLKDGLILFRFVVQEKEEKLEVSVVMFVVVLPLLILALFAIVPVASIEVFGGEGGLQIKTLFCFAYSFNSIPALLRSRRYFHTVSLPIRSLAGG